MTAVTIRRPDADTAVILVDGNPVLSVCDLDEDGGREGELSVAWAAEQTAEAVGRALGADVTIERTKR